MGVISYYITMVQWIVSGIAATAAALIGGAISVIFI